MRLLITAVILTLLIAFGMGCAGQYLGKTEASFETPEGLKGRYVSNKNQENFSVSSTIVDGKVTGIDIKTTATTPEAAIMAALESMRLFMDSVRRQLDAAKTGALAGS